jgi:selenocysteine lyase/cysteine desulfurase
VILDLSDRFELGDRAYLDGANHGPMPRRALAAARRALEWKRDPALLDDGEYFAAPDRLRRLAAGLLGCESQQIAVATGASHGISLVACGLDWRPGDRVVIPSGEFPANRLPWLALAELGVEVSVVDPDEIVDSICARTRVVSVGHVNFASGRRLDIDAIGDACHGRGIVFVVDAAQSFGALPLDAIACRATVIAMAGYKWLMSPYGTGLTYVRAGDEERFRLPHFNWATIEGAADFNRLTDLAPRHRPGAIRFDVPETAAFVQTAAMVESLRLLEQVGPEAAFAHSRALIDRLAETLPAAYRIESSLSPPRRSSFVRVVASDARRTIATHVALRRAGVAVSLRESGLRFAPGIWSTPADVDRFVAVLQSAGG